MKKRIISFVLVIALVMSGFTFVNAADDNSDSEVGTYAVGIHPRLTFEGSTAKCTATVVKANAYIHAYITLFQGEYAIASWSASGDSAVYIEGTAQVTPGQEYWMRVTGNVDGQAFTGSKLYGTCPSEG